MRILTTGAAGFIGSHVAHKLLDRGDEVVGFDSLNDYYDPTLKEARLDKLNRRDGFTFYRGLLEDEVAISRAFDEAPDTVIHLAAQAGVRYSIDNPRAYIDANVVGFLNVLEGCRYCKVEHLVYASSSSVYGANTSMPFSVHDNVDHPVSLYAATKKMNELMAHTYSHLYRVPTTGLRFFTVYGPWGRPDMALFLFTKAILEGKPIQLFNDGRMRRDFTFIDDIVEGVIRALNRVASPNPAWSGDSPDPATSSSPYAIYNIGSSRPVELLDFVRSIEAALGMTAKLDLQPMQPGDVAATFADVDDLVRDIDFTPATPLDVGVLKFIEWYKEYYDV